MKKIPSRDEITAIHAGAGNVRNEIDRMLEKGRPYAEICDFIRTQSRELAAWDQSMHILNRMASIAAIELEAQVDRYLFAGRTTEQIIRLYRRTVLYLRRIEFDLPTELQQAGIDYIKSEQISIFALYGIIQSTRILFCKEIIWERLQKYIQMGEL